MREQPFPRRRTKYISPVVAGRKSKLSCHRAPRKPAILCKSGARCGDCKKGRCSLFEPPGMDSNSENTHLPAGPGDNGATLPPTVVRTAAELVARRPLSIGVWAHRDSLRTLRNQFEARAARSTGLHHLMVEGGDRERHKMSGPPWFEALHGDIQIVRAPDHNPPDTFFF
jgi:hypothetical protein